MKKKILLFLLTLLLICGLMTITAQAETVVVRGTYGENVTWTLDSEGCLVISGSGILSPTNSSHQIYYPWAGSSMRIKEIRIEEGITSIGEFAFEAFTNLETLTIPKSVTYIGTSAFFNCWSIRSITIPDGVVKIAMTAFYGCDNLSSIIIPSSVESIGDEAFYGCDNLDTIEFLGDAPEIGKNVFEKDITVFYHTGTDGWSSPIWNGYKSVCIDSSGDENLNVQMVTFSAFPQIGANVSSITASGNKFTVMFGDWKNVKNQTITEFKDDDEYTVNVTLTADDGNTFDSGATVNIAGDNKGKVSNVQVSQDGKTLTFLYKYSMIKQEQIITAPKSQIVKYGSSLDLNTVCHGVAGATLTYTLDGTLPLGTTFNNSVINAGTTEGKFNIKVNSAAFGDYRAAAEKIIDVSIRAKDSVSGGGTATSAGKPSVSTSGGGGKVTADGNGKVTITPDDGFKIKDVTVNGKSVGIKAELTGLTKQDKVVVTFVKIDDLAAISDFVDVPSGHWASEAVNYVYTNGLFQGISKNVFGPNIDMSRGMIVTVLWRLDGQTQSGAHTFSDVASDTYYSAAVAWANANGIIKGIDDTHFAPNSNVTREQMAVIFERYASFKGYTVNASSDISAFADRDKVSSYAIDGMIWANGAGLITGRTATMLAPQGDATRAEVAVIVQRFAQNVVK